MSDLEAQVRAALTDPRRRIAPDAALLQRLDQRVLTARRRRGVRRAGAAGALTAAVLLGVFVVGGRSGEHPLPGGPQPGASPSGTGTPSEEPTVESRPTTPASNITGRVIDVVAGDRTLYVLQSSPPQVLRIDPATHEITGTLPAPSSVPSLVAGLAVDPATSRLWTWAAVSGGQTIREYDVARMSVRREVSVPTGQVFSAAALNGELWLVGDDGVLYRLPPDQPSAERVPGMQHPVDGVAADPARRRILVGETLTTGKGGRMVAIDPVTLAHTVGAELGQGKRTIVVVGDQIWTGGYTSGDEPRLVRLDPGTLQIAGTSPVNALVGPGAVLWPGADVLWVRHGGNLDVTCVDPVDGRILGRWHELQGPVVSVTKGLFAVNEGRAGWLTPDASCPG